MSIKIFKKEWIGPSGIEWVVGKAYTPSEIRAFYFDLGRVEDEYYIPNETTERQPDGRYKVIWTPEWETEWCVGDRVENQEEFDSLCAKLETIWGKDRYIWPKWLCHLYDKSVTYNYYGGASLK